MPDETATRNGKLDAEVKGRVPKRFIEVIDAEVARRRESFPRTSRGDVLRDALAEYFENHPVQSELLLEVAQGNGR